MRVCVLSRSAFDSCQVGLFVYGVIAFMTEPKAPKFQEAWGALYLFQQKDDEAQYVVCSNVISTVRISALRS